MLTKKKRSFLIIFFVIAVTAAVIVRYMQFIAPAVDFTTGFFLSTAGFVQHLHYIILAISFIVMIILAVVEKRRKTRFFNKKMNQFDETDLAFSGIMFMLAGFSVLYTAFHANFLNAGISEILIVIIGTLSYGFAGGILLFRKRAFPSVGVSLLILSVYYVIRLAQQFLDNYIIINMSEHLIRLIITTLLALFYLSAGRMFMRAETKTTRVKACIFGCFGGIVLVSEIIAKLTFWFGSPAVSRPPSSSKFIMPDMLMASEAIALVIFLLCMTRDKQDKPEPEKEAAE